MPITIPAFWKVVPHLEYKWLAVKITIKGVSIVADTKPEALPLIYLHIELDTHEAILAEGLAVESFQRDNLHAFDNADEYVRLYVAFDALCANRPLQEQSPRVGIPRRR